MNINYDRNNHKYKVNQKRCLLTLPIYVRSRGRNKAFLTFASRKRLDVAVEVEFLLFLRLSLLFFLLYRLVQYQFLFLFQLKST